jgi:glucose-6-phosphate 1-dehydrogenase
MDANPRKRPAPCAFVIFGATGDLAKRKLFPALCNLARDELLPEDFRLVGYGRNAMSDDDFRKHVSEAIGGDCTPLVAKARYLQGQYDDPAGFAKLKDVTKGNALFYLSVPPELFEPIVRQLGDAGLLAEDGGWRRVIIEKPFGHDLRSAIELDQELKKHAKERQYFRIDHYLGKETVQNVLAFRFANGIIEPIWRNHYIDNVQITVAEELGVEQRAGYYDQTGAVRDMVPNHLLQLVAMLAMEPPASLAAEAVRDEKSKLLSSIRVGRPGDTGGAYVRGQYEGYRSEPDVKKDSDTETFSALELRIENWRWAGVPFYLRTGKKMARRVTSVVVEFKAAPHIIFPQATPVNLLVLNIQPEEGIRLRLGAKVPGTTMNLAPVEMTFTYGEYFGSKPNTGYETLIYDALMGDATLFQRADTIELGWKIVQPFLDTPPPLMTYAQKSWGPREADAMLEREGRHWHSLPPRLKAEP